MSDQRRFQWKSGRLTSAPIQDGWAIDLDSRDPSIPNLPLESPAAPAVSNDIALSKPFQTRVTASRKRRDAAWSAELAPTQAAPPAFPVAAVFGVRATRRRTTERRIVEVEDLHWQYIAPTVAAILPAPKAKVVKFRRTLRVPLENPTYPATPSTGPPSLAAYGTRPTLRRKSRVGLLLTSGDVIHAPTPVTTSVADEPAFKARRLPPTKFHRKLLVAVGPLHVAAATPPAPSNDRPTVEAFQTRVSRSRKHLTAPDVIGVQPATPPQIVPYLDAASALRRRDTARRLAVTPDVLHVAPAAPTPTPYLDAPTAARRRKTARARRDVELLLEHPQTPPVPPQPVTAWQLPVAFYTAFQRRLQAAAPQLEHPETPPVVVVPPLGGDDKPDARKHPGWDKRRSELKRSAELRLESDIREIYRRLQGNETLAPRAAEVLQRVAIEPTQPNDAIIRALARRSTAADALAMDAEIALRMLLAEMQEQEAADDELALALILSLL